MSGHSKWSSIKRQKGVADSKRSAVFSKMAAAITVAARTGGDPSMNFQLRIAVDKAKAANMPKDNIDRAIDRAVGPGAAALDEIIFESYGPSGTAYLIETATDNRNRTIGEIRAALNRHGGKLAEAGAVSYMFKKRGELVIPADNNMEAIELALIEANAEDYEEVGDKVYAYTDTKALEAVREALISNNITVEEAGFVFTPNSLLTLDDVEAAKKAIAFTEALEDIADVTHVFSNFDIPEGLVE